MRLLYYGIFFLSFNIDNVDNDKTVSQLGIAEIKSFHLSEDENTSENVVIVEISYKASSVEDAYQLAMCYAESVFGNGNCVVLLSQNNEKEETAHFSCIMKKED